MHYERRFKLLICAPVFDAEDLEGQRLAQIVTEIEKIGFGVVKAHKADDADLVIRTDAAIGCIVLDWGKRGPQGKMAALISFIRKRGLEEIPVDVLHEADGYVFLAEETPDFIAKNLASRLKQYAEIPRRPLIQLPPRCPRLRDDRPQQAHLAHSGLRSYPGHYTDHGVPAPVLAQYLRENRIVPEKNELNSILFLLTPGVESSKGATLLSALVFFKRLHDDNAKIEDAIPEFVRARPKRYGGMRLRDLCAEIHTFCREQAISTL